MLHKLGTLSEFEAQKERQTKGYQNKYESFFTDFIKILSDLIVADDLIGIGFFEETLFALISTAKDQIVQE